ncbi:MAG: DUF1016 N-terminal domain-containing protein [Bacteroidota bacterium]|nr:DUF1016 N-terminal domain-containing protein [Bacteroidota bacterium]
MIKDLSFRLSKEYGRGFTETNLKYMRQFYQTFENSHALRDELSWTHYRILLKVERENARNFYMQEAINGNWSTRQLESKPSAWYIFHGIGGSSIFGEKDTMNRTEQADLRQEMFSIIRKYLKSNMSAQDFYRQHNLTEHRFYYWRRKYMDHHHPSGKGFVPVEVHAPAHPLVNDTRGDIQIHYPNGVQVILDRSVSISRIKALIKAI